MRHVAIASIAVLFSATAGLAADIVTGTDNGDSGVSVRFGVATGSPLDVEMTGGPFRGVAEIDLSSDNLVRPYIGISAPIALTDTWSILMNGDISFTQWDGWDVNSLMLNSIGNTVADRDFQETENGYWASAELLAAYDIGDTLPFDAKVFGGVRYGYDFTRVNNPQGTLANAADYMQYWQQTITPVIGVSATFQGPRQGNLGGDIHLSAMAGPVLWGRSDYNEGILNGTNDLHMASDIESGYFWKLYGDVEIFSSESLDTSGVGGAVALFAQVSQTRVSGSGMMEDFSTAGGFATPQPFDFDSNTLGAAFGVSASLMF